MDLRTSRHSSRRADLAFTLIEVLVSISVVAVLLSITLTAVRASRSEAESVACKMRLGDCMRLHTAYSAMHQGRWANDFEPATRSVAWFFSTSIDSSTVSVGAAATITQADYWPGPLRNGGVVEADDPPEAFACPTVFREWNQPGLPRGILDMGARSYLYSPALFTEAALWAPDLPVSKRNPDSFRKSVRIEEVTFPTRKVAMFERADHHGARIKLLFPEPQPSAAEMSALRVNAAFCDGHVERVAPVQARPAMPMLSFIWTDEPPAGIATLSVPFCASEWGHRGRDFD